MEVENTVSENVRRSRSKTPISQINSTNSTRDRVLRKRQGSATSTPIEENSSTNLLPIDETTPEPELEPVIVAASDNVGEKSKNRRSGRPKVGLVTNGSTKKVQETITTTSTTNTSTTTSALKKSVAAREKLMKDTKTSDYSSDEEEEKFKAYKIYKASGEWWNVFPKTDYTYSDLSNSRIELAPGVYNPPNMSRPGLSPDRYKAWSTSTQQRVQHSEEQASYEDRTVFAIRRPRSQGTHLAREVQYDSYSDDDEEILHASRNVTTTSSSWSIMWVFVAAWHLITTVWQSTWRALGWHTVPATPTHNPAPGSSVWAYLFYFPLLWATAADTWLLSRVHASNGNPRQPNSRRWTYYFIGLLLLCLLLLTGVYFAQTNSSDFLIPFPSLNADASLSYAQSCLISAKTSVLEVSSTVYEFFSYLTVTIWDTLYLVASAVYDFFAYIAFYLYSFFEFVALHVYAFFSALGLVVADFFTHFPTTFIEFFTPLYNVFSPLFDLQLTLPNMF